MIRPAFKLTVRPLVAAAGLTLLLAGAAQAQEPDGADLEAEAALLGETGLLEKAPTEEPVLVDPDEKLKKKVGDIRTQVEQKINTIQRQVSKFPDLDEGLNELNLGMLKGIEGYIEAHNEALEKFRAAHEKGDEKAKKKLGKQVEKLRTTFIKQLEKLDKKADKLVAEAQKLEEKLAAQKAEEDAEAADGEREGGGAKDDEGDDGE